MEGKSRACVYTQQGRWQKSSEKMRSVRSFGKDEQTFFVKISIKNTKRTKWTPTLHWSVCLRTIGEASKRRFNQLQKGRLPTCDRFENMSLVWGQGGGSGFDQIFVHKLSFEYLRVSGEAKSFRLTNIVSCVAICFFVIWGLKRRLCRVRCTRVVGRLAWTCLKKRGRVCDAIGRRFSTN